MYLTDKKQLYETAGWWMRWQEDLMKDLEAAMRREKRL
jgi:hypothetical protein